MITYWAFLCGTSITYDLALTIYKIAASNNRSLTIKFLLECWCELNGNHRRTLLQFPIELLDKIIRKEDPPDVLQILLKKIPSLPSNIKDMLLLAGYPREIFINETSKTNYIGNGNRETITRYKFKYPHLLQSPNANDEPPFWDTLYYLGKFPKLYQGDDKLDNKTLVQILSLRNPKPAFEFLCHNTSLWQGPNALDPDYLSQMVCHQHIGLISTWLPLFQESGIIPLHTLNIIFNLNDYSEANWTKLIQVQMQLIVKKNQLACIKNNPKGLFLNIDKVLNDLTVINGM